ncbi:MAG: 5'-nucleotidase C-terminal domain-containing protein, partial [Muribaculaceae bacterium]|nr:5'-nucleotidase C-terminal domain-containing protein [Muribaculaceae bacterium]
PFDAAKTYKVAINSYRGNGGGNLLTDGAGIALKDLPERIVSSTDKDLRYYLMEYIASHPEGLNPQPLNQWRFIPEEIASPAAARDRALLFPE